MDHKKYEKNVAEGMKLYSQVQKIDSELYRIKKQIAKLALEVCDIGHGGMSGSRYTITRFSDDAKIPRKTLSEWIRIFRLSKVLGVEINSHETWGKVSYVNRQRALMVSAKNLSEGQIGAKAKMEDISSDEAQSLKKLYKGVSDYKKSKKSSDSLRIRGLLMLVKQFQSNLKAVAYLDRNELSIEELVHLKMLLDKSEKLVDRAIVIEKQ